LSSFCCFKKSKGKSNKLSPLSLISTKLLSKKFVGITNAIKFGSSTTFTFIESSNCILFALRVYCSSILKKSSPLSNKSFAFFCVPCVTLIWYSFSFLGSILKSLIVINILSLQILNIYILSNINQQINEIQFLNSVHVSYYCQFKMCRLMNNKIVYKYSY